MSAPTEQAATAPASHAAVSDARTDVLIVGGGVAGVSLLHALSRRGASVMLIDEGAVGAQGASSLPVALLNPHRGRTGRASSLDLAGAASFWVWAEALEEAGVDAGAHRSGVLRVASSRRQQDLWRALDGPTPLTGADYPAHVTARYGGMLVAGGWVEPRRWLSALTRTAAGAGAVIAENVALMELSGANPVVAITSAGTVTAREVVLCLGAYDPRLLRLPRLDLAPGLAVTVDPGLHLVGEAARPIAGSLGIVFTGGKAVITGTAHTGDEADVTRLVSSAAWFVPAVAGAPVTSVWRGVRARRPSGVPVVRRLRSGVTLFGAMGGRGFLCSALVAESLADRLVTRPAVPR